MMSSLTRSVLICVLVLPLTTPLVAAQPGLDVVGITVRDASPQVQLVAFGDGPPTGAHRGKRARSSDVPKAVEPSHADMHGATREDADKAYRKKYGF